MALICRVCAVRLSCSNGNFGGEAQPDRRIFRSEEQYGDGTAAAQATYYRLAEMYKEWSRLPGGTRLTWTGRQLTCWLASRGLSGDDPAALRAGPAGPPAHRLLRECAGQRGRHLGEAVGRLAFSTVQTEYCDPADLVVIYEIVRSAAVGRDGAMLSTIIDITGGKKVMSAGAALAASQLDLPMCYIDSDFDPQICPTRPFYSATVRWTSPPRCYGPGLRWRGGPLR